MKKEIYECDSCQNEINDTHEMVSLCDDGYHLCDWECLDDWIKQLVRRNMVDRANNWLYKYERFVLAHNGDVVIDQKTGLMWDRIGSEEEMNYQNAKEYAESLNLAGFDDWRLPTIEELFSIVDYTVDNPAISSIFNCQSDLYWSSATYTPDTGNAWYVNFDNGFVNSSTKLNTFYARCCRTIE